MEKRYFGTDGVRGVVGKEPMTAGFLLRLGYVAGRVLIKRHLEQDNKNRPSVLIGKDTRFSGHMIEAALEAGFTASGVDVTLCGVLPTPGVAFLTKELCFTAGVVISASHNLFEDNGVKFFSGDGFKFPDEFEIEVEHALALETSVGCNKTLDLGRVHSMSDAEEKYIDFCKSTFPAGMSLRGIKIIIDCANGAAYRVAPKVFRELGATVVVIGDNPDGFNINASCGATSPANIRAAVLEHGANIGIAFDGDADRVMMVDHTGRIYDGDELLYIIVSNRAKHENIAGVVGTLMTNMALEKALCHQGINFMRAKVGDRYVVELLRKQGWLYGGENSGHIIRLDQHTTGDGTVASLQVLAAFCESNKLLSQLVEPLTLFPQKMINMRIPDGFDWEAHMSILEAKRDAESELGTNGRVLLRLSGTEPVLRIMVESKSEEQSKRLAEQIAAIIKKVAEKV